MPKCVSYYQLVSRQIGKQPSTLVPLSVAGRWSRPGFLWCPPLVGWSVVGPPGARGRPGRPGPSGGSVSVGPCLAGVGWGRCGPVPPSVRAAGAGGAGPLGLSAAPRPPWSVPRWWSGVVPARLGTGLWWGAGAGGPPPPVRAVSSGAGGAGPLKFRPRPGCGGPPALLPVWWLRAGDSWYRLHGLSAARLPTHHTPRQGSR